MKVNLLVIILSLMIVPIANAESMDIESYKQLGRSYYLQGKHDQAIEQFKKILSIEPENSDSMYFLGALYLETNRIQKAKDILEKSISIDPEHSGCLNTLGYVYIEEGKNIDRGKELINRALKNEPDNGAYLDSLGFAYYKEKKYEKALELFLMADARFKDPVILGHIGDSYQKLNQFENAIKYWKESLELNPNQKSLVVKINDIIKKSNKFRE